jgi:hypothetical protein
LEIVKRGKKKEFAKENGTSSMRNNSKLERQRIGRLDALKELQLQEDGVTPRSGVFERSKRDFGGVRMWRQYF